MNFESVKGWIDAGMPFNSFVCGDCMEAMREMPDNFADLCICDPPYGLGESSKDFASRSRLADSGRYVQKEWDNKKPNDEYFIELFRVSKKTIIWGGNYFTDNLNEQGGWIVWDKDNGENDFADCEMAWTNFGGAVRIFRWRWHGMLQQNMKYKEIRIHPTQKPVALYRWILNKYAQAGWKILDTHVGSASSLIACEWEGFDYIGFEIDREYFEAACKRMDREREKMKQMKLL